MITSVTSWRLLVIAALAVLMLTAGSGLAQAPRLSETTIPPSGPATILRDPPRVAPAPAPAATISAPSPSSLAPRPPVQKINYFPYTVKPGDSLSALALQFGVAQEELARVNRLRFDAQLVEGIVLRIPNPFDSQVKLLASQVQQLGAELATAENRARETESRLRAARVESEQMTSDVQLLRQGVQALPWWRGASLGAGIVAILMFGVMAVTLFEWWRIRHRFLVLAGLAETLGHLDHKYKAMMAKAELRLQQLYGRRRQGMTEGQPRPKLPEEVEIERLNTELKEVLAHHIARLAPRSARKHRHDSIRDVIGDVEPPVEVRTTVRR